MPSGVLFNPHSGTLRPSGRPRHQALPEWVKTVRLAREVDDLSVSVQVAALAFVTTDAVAAVDLVCAGDLIGHDANELA